MKAIVIYSILFLACCLSCKKSNICKDEELTLVKNNYAGDELKLDGFYYGNPDTGYNDMIRHELLVFYNNGTTLLPGVSEYDELEQEMNSLIASSELLKRSKFLWGIFAIENNAIKIENWEAGQCGYPVKLRSGVIINDTTFILTEENIRSKQGTDTKMVQQTFHYRQFSEKPDSTSSFIN